MKFSFRIRKRYFDDIVAGKKKVEYRRDIPFWRVRIGKIINHRIMRSIKFIVSLDNVDAQAVFICGKRIHRRKVTAIFRIKTPDDFSDQGKKDVDTEFCFGFHLGDAMIE